jgi:lipoate-protein ligase A
VVRGGFDDPERDRRCTRALLDGAADGETALRVWAPARHLAFGRRDARADGYERARAAAARRGFPPVERDVGGRAVAFSGTTVALAHATPAAGRGDIGARYADALATLRAALATLGVDARPGEPPDSFCPGAHSLRAGGKLAGLAQRVRGGAALVVGVVVVDDASEIAGVLAPVYDALGVPFDPDSVGSVAAAGGPADPAAVRRAVEDAFVGEREREVAHVRDRA